MMPETVGQQLNRARKERGLTLDKIARMLHIRVEYLRALEEDKSKVLPSPVHARGFLRMYADHLGISSQTLLDQWDGKLPLPQVEITEAGPSQTIQPAEQEVFASVIDQPAEIEIAGRAEPPEAVEQQSEEYSEEDFVEEELGEEQLISPEPKSPSTSGSAFLEIGERLRKQRLALNLSIAEIERYIHVRQHYLNALEDGRIGELPSPVQGRGMLSNYAHFLNLDVEGLLLLFAEGLQSRREERLPPSLTQKKEDPRSPRPKKAPRRLLSLDLLVSIVLVMIILGFALWTAAQVDSLNSDRSGTATPPSIADVLLNNPTITPPPSATPTVLANLSTLAPGEVGSRPNANTPDVNATVPVSGDLPLQVYVVALQRAYLRITVDSKVVFDGRVVPGNAYPFNGNEKIELLTGSAAAIQVFFNQEDLGVLGLVGQVKSYIFSIDGAVTPTPMFTATPTRTTQPTSTSQPSPTAPTSTITPFIP